jgi:hypothetical protein
MNAYNNVINAHNVNKCVNIGNMNAHNIVMNAYNVIICVNISSIDAWNNVIYVNIDNMILCTQINSGLGAFINARKAAHQAVPAKAEQTEKDEQKKAALEAILK